MEDIKMDAKSVNKKLNDLYDQLLNKDLADKYDIKEYTYPVLMQCNSEYCNSGTKILFITQEKKTGSQATTATKNRRSFALCII